MRLAVQRFLHRNGNGRRYCGNFNGNNKRGRVSNEAPPTPTPAPTPLVLDRKTIKAVAILSGSQFLSNISFGIIIPVLPQFAAELGLGASGIGLILSTPAVARIFLNIPFGKAADIYGRRPLMIGGAIISAAGSFSTYAAHTVLTIIPARLLGGIGTAASMAGSSAYMADITAQVPDHRAKIMGVQQAMVTTAFIAGPAIGGFLAEAYGARPAFAIVGAALVGSSALFSALEEPKRSEQSQGEGSGSGQVLHLLKCPDQQAIAAMNTALFFGYAAQMVLVPLHAAAVLSASTSQIGMLFSVACAGGLVGSPIGGYLADKYGKKSVIIPGSLTAAIGSLAVISSSTYPTFLVSSAMWGLGCSLIHPAITALAADVAPPEHRGAALSLGRQAGDLSFLFGPLTLGFIADYFSCGTSLAVTAGCYVAAAFFFVMRAGNR